MFHRRGDAEESEREPAEAEKSEEASSKLVLTETELERRIQAETDRREYKRQAEARAKQKRELRDKDPWAYAEQERKDEELATGTNHQQQFIQMLGAEHDKASLDPLVEVLPAAERERIFAIEGAGRGLEGRRLVVKESLKALEKHWKAEGAKDAEAKLRRNPAFRKQVLSESRGSVQEPELLPSVGGASEADKTVSALLRSHYRLG
jgi:hypothetical protein